MLAAVAIAFTSGFAGPLLLTPAFAIVLAVIANSGTTIARWRTWVLVLAYASFLVPQGLAWLDVLPDSYRCNGVVIVDEGARLVVVEQGGGWIGVALFVAALLTLIFTVNGVAMIGMVSPIAGAIVLAVGVVAALVTFQLWKARKRSRERGRTGTPQLVFDLAAGVLRDPGGATIAPLAQVRLARTFQIGSSSKGLAAAYPGGEHVFARGTPFGDSVDSVEHALRARYPFPP